MRAPHFTEQGDVGFKSGPADTDAQHPAHGIQEKNANTSLLHMKL